MIHRSKSTLAAEETRARKRTVVIRLAGALLVVTTAMGCNAGTAGRQRAMVELDVLRNALDGSGHRGCRISTEIETGRQDELWVTFGEVVPNPERGWEAIGASTRCGSGAFAKVSPGFTRVIGIPYLVLDISISPEILPSGEGHLKTSVQIRKLSGFDEEGDPVYARSSHERTLGLENESPLTLPLLVADDGEKEAFGVYEVLVRLKAWSLVDKPAVAYGVIAVSADVPGAEILLDGGLVGRTSEESPTLLNTVLAGQREIRVRDLSGRQVRKLVAVKKNQTVQVAFDLLRLSSLETSQGLSPIGSNPQGHEEYWRREDGAVVVKIPAGEFLMGSPEDVGEPREQPQHRVYVSEFLMDKTEVTWRQFRKYATITGAPLPPEPIWGTADDYPVSGLLWEEAKAYCEWVGGRLPTEAEWEKAARGTDAQIYPWGDLWDPDRCNSWIGGPNQPLGVGTLPNCVSPYGLIDMAGNLWEWCADVFEENYYAESPQRDPQGPASGSHRVLRGGDWIAQPLHLRAANRHRMTPKNRNRNNGFRCVQERAN